MTFANSNTLLILTKGTTVCNVDFNSVCHAHQQDLTILTHNHIPIGTYILSVDLLLDLIEGSREFDSWIELIEGSKEKLSSSFVETAGYAKDISTLQDFYQANMDILAPEKLKSLLFEENTIYRKDFEIHPTVYGSSSQVMNSLIGQGCLIDGNIESSIVFPNCKIHKDVSLKNCIVMEDSSIETGKFEQVILNPSYTIETCQFYS